MVMKWSCHKATPSEQKRTSLLEDLVSQRCKHTVEFLKTSKNKKLPTTILPPLAIYHSASEPHLHFGL